MFVQADVLSTTVGAGNLERAREIYALAAQVEAGKLQIGGGIRNFAVQQFKERGSYLLGEPFRDPFRMRLINKAFDRGGMAAAKAEIARLGRTNNSEPFITLGPCVLCGHCGATEKKLKLCSGCGVALYCGAACQKIGWQLGHKTACTALKESKAASKEKATAAK